MEMKTLLINLTVLLLSGHAVVAAEISHADQMRLTGRYAEAERDYRSLLSDEDLDGDDAEKITIGLSRCLWETGKAKEAVDVLSTFLSGEAKATNARTLLAEFQLSLGDFAAAESNIIAIEKSSEKDVLPQLGARYLHAELHRLQGKLKLAEEGYEWLIDRSRERHEFGPQHLRYIARAAERHAEWNRNSAIYGQLVNEYYPAALKAEPKYWPAHLEMARLFAAKYNASAAAKEIAETLAINPQAAAAYALKAELAVQNFEFESAEAAIKRALAINPRETSALVAQADIEMLAFRTEAAVETLKKAVEIAPHDERILGRLTAAYTNLTGSEKETSDQVTKLIDEATQRNPHCGDFFFSLATGLDLQRKFPKAAKYYREAKEKMPRMLGPNSELGLMQMRLGNEAEAATLLAEAFEVDPFNVRVKNTLAVLEMLQNYATLETEHFIIRFDRGQDELLAKYVADYLETTVFPEVTGRLGFEPPKKTLLEIFSRTGRTSGHQWFSARMVGLPYIHTVGACAGEMIAMVSPNDIDKPFNWAVLLRHEYTHVVNLQQTNFNIPHWFTEALAVQSEQSPRPVAFLEVLAARHAADDLFDLDSINFGFERPRDQGDWTLAYCQAELYADYMIVRFGDDAPSKMLAAYAENLPTADAIQKKLGVSKADFEAGYREHIANVLSTFRSSQEDSIRDVKTLQAVLADDPTDATAHAELAFQHLRRDAKPAARKAALAAIKIDPQQPLAAYVMARLYLSIGDAKTAIETLAEIDLEKRPQSNAIALLAGIRLKQGDFAAAEKLYLLGEKHAPHPDKWLKLLARVHLAAKDDEKLTPILTQLAELDNDNVNMPLKLAQLSQARKDFPAMQRWARRAMEANIQEAKAHALLAEALAEQEKWEAAIKEYEVSVELAPEMDEWRAALKDLVSRNSE